MEPESLLARIDRTAGASVKDSFATLNLAAAGFAVLFEAEWIFRAAGVPPGRGALRWASVGRPADLDGWAHDHGGGPNFVGALLEEPSVVVLAGHDRGGRRVAGAIATVGDRAVGISNVFVVGVADSERPATFADAFAGATAAIVERFPDLAVVGYLAGARLDAARLAGFETVGPLRVWLHRSSVGDTADA